MKEAILIVQNQFIFERVGGPVTIANKQVSLEEVNIFIGRSKSVFL